MSRARMERRARKKRPLGVRFNKRVSEVDVLRALLPVEAAIARVRSRIIREAADRLDSDIVGRVEVDYRILSEEAGVIREIEILSAPFVPNQEARKDTKSTKPANDAPPVT
jgi:hypothetical protein